MIVESRLDELGLNVHKALQKVKSERVRRKSGAITDRHRRRALGTSGSRCKSMANFRRRKTSRHTNFHSTLYNHGSLRGGGGELTIEEKLAQLPTLASYLHSKNSKLQLEAAAELRKLVSIERNPPLQQVIDCGVVPRLLQLLDRQENMDLQFEAAWALTNLLSGNTDHTHHVIEHGAIPKFVELLKSPSDDVKEQVVWALGNMAGDSPACRDLVLKYGAMEPLLDLCKDRSPLKLTLRRNLIWTISNLCRGKPKPKFELVIPALTLPVVSWLINCFDEEVLVDACWALSYLSDDHSGANIFIEACVKSGVVPRLVELLTHSSVAIQTPALRTIGNIVTGSDTQTSAVVQANALPALRQLLSHGKKGIRKEAVWAISNITAGTSGHIQAVLDEGIIPHLFEMLETATFDIRKEAAWAISNATSGGTDEQTEFLVEIGVIPALCGLLDVQVPRVLDVALSGLDNILKLGRQEQIVKKIEENGQELEIQVNPYAEMIEECHGVDKLENLQLHPNEEVYTKAFNILENYFIIQEYIIGDYHNSSASEEAQLEPLFLPKPEGECGVEPATGLVSAQERSKIESKPNQQPVYTVSSSIDEVD